MFFRMLYDRKLAQASYVIGCQRTGEALVIDPQRDIERYLAAAQDAGLRITAVAETHIHADFLSGARELAERIPARLYLSDEGDADWKYQWLDRKSGGGTYDYQLLKHGDVFKVGNIELEVLHTPGHTPEHLCFLVTDKGGGVTEPMGIATGDFVFVGDVGRPDLLETAAGLKGSKESSAIALFESLKGFKMLPDYLQLWPGHGAGSACGKALGAVPQSTVGYEKRFNAAILEAIEQSGFVRSILTGQPAPPLYFSRMKRLNKEGPPILGKLPHPGEFAASEIPSLPDRGAAILDTRPWPLFAQGHIRGSLHTPLNNSFPTIAGSFVSEDQEIILVVDENRSVEAVTDLVHVGLDNIAGIVTPEILSQTGNGLNRMPERDIADLLNGLPAHDSQLLDVRQQDEFENGHLKGSLNIPHTRLLAELERLPKDRTLLVYCQSGSRSAYGAALLRSKGFDAVQLNGGYAAWEKAHDEANDNT